MCGKFNHLYNSTPCHSEESVKNGQGDIMALIDRTGTEVVSYTYDTWGEAISIFGTLVSTVGQKNPYRYRGYRYDNETGLYYLQSRYYNPEWGRFINADGLVGAPGNLVGHNMFAYCQNNPVNMYDPNGDFPFTVVGEITIRGTLSQTSKLYLLDKGYTLAYEMFKHGLYGGGKELEFGPYSTMANKLRQSSKMNDAIKGFVSDAENDGNISFAKTKQSIEFGSGDLYYSIQHAKYNVNGYKYNGIWVVRVSLRDKYDFTEFRNPLKSMGNAANDLGLFSQATGVLDSYISCSILEMGWRK